MCRLEWKEHVMSEKKNSIAMDDFSQALDYKICSQSNTNGGDRTELKNKFCDDNWNDNVMEERVQCIKVCQFHHYLNIGTRCSSSFSESQNHPCRCPICLIKRILMTVGHSHSRTWSFLHMELHDTFTILADCPSTFTGSIARQKTHIS